MCVGCWRIWFISSSQRWQSSATGMHAAQDARDQPQEVGSSCVCSAPATIAALLLPLLTSTVWVRVLHLQVRVKQPYDIKSCEAAPEHKSTLARVTKVVSPDSASAAGTSCCVALHGSACITRAGVCRSGAACGSTCHSQAARSGSHLNAAAAYGQVDGFPDERV